MFMSLLILLGMPILDIGRTRGSEFRPMMQLSFVLLVGTFFVLMFIGSQHVESPYVEIGQVATALYFGWFLVIVPVVGVIENTLMDIALEQHTQTNSVTSNIEQLAKTKVNYSNSPFNMQRRIYHTSKIIIKTSANKNINYIDQVFEKDNGQVTDNVHLIARRHIASTFSTDHIIINKVLKLNFTEKNFIELINIKPFKISNFNDKKDLFIKMKDLYKQYNSGNRLSGVYVFTNIITQEQYVGSSLNLIRRIISYFSIKNKGTRKINIHISIIETNDINLELYIINDKLNNNNIKDNILFLEQYLIFTLKPSLNVSKVANTVDNLKIIPVYIIINDKVIYCSGSQLELIIKFKISLSSSGKAINKGNKLYDTLTITRNKPENIEMQIINDNEFLILVNNLRKINLKKGALRNIDKYLAYKEKQKIKVIAENHFIKEVLVSDSIIDISYKIINIPENYHVSYSYIKYCIKNDKITKNG